MPYGARKTSRYYIQPSLSVIALLRSAQGELTSVKRPHERLTNLVQDVWVEALDREREHLEVELVGAVLVGGAPGEELDVSEECREKLRELPNHAGLLLDGKVDAGGISREEPEETVFVDAVGVAGQEVLDLLVVLGGVNLHVHAGADVQVDGDHSVIQSV